MKAGRVVQICRISVCLLLALTLRSALDPPSMAEREPAPPTPQPHAPPAVALRAASGATIPFRTQNGRTVGGVPPQTLELPHLVLYRNGRLTDPAERTVVLELSGIEVPPAGLMVTLESETQDSDPDLGGQADGRIAMWQESQRVANTVRITQTGATVAFAHTFTETVAADGRMVATPSGYLRYDLTVVDAAHPPSRPLYAFSADYALLMENQWVARLPEVREASSPGAAPDELIVYYCDMVPFFKSPLFPATWLSREEVTHYVGTELVPRMVEAFRVQTDGWGFPWYPEWTSYRAKEAERLTVALTDGRTWFHGWAPDRGHSGISLRVSGGGNIAYDTLTDGLMSSFHHELFHNLQRNISLHGRGDGDVDGREKAWQFYSEGTAVLASSVGQPGVQFSQTLRARTYMHHVNNLLLWGSGQYRDLNTSYSEVDPYQAALYWRFLYEQCAGSRDGVEDPAAGMQVIRDALRALYAGDVVDIGSSTDLVGALPRIVDRALAGSSCPFQTYRESLTAFARVLYGLRTEGGRCVEPGRPAGCGLYDPNDQYQVPPVREVAFTGQAQQFRGEIGSSFGIDFVDVILDSAVDGQLLTLEFRGVPGSDAEFNLQIVRLMDSEGGVGLRRVPGAEGAGEFQARPHPDGRLSYAIPAVEMAACNRLGLIITRVDAREASDPLGEYTVVLRPGVAVDGGGISESA